MNRDDLIEHLRPRVEQFTAKLATTLWERFETQIEQALDVALSALESALCIDEPAPDVRRIKAEPVPTDSKPAPPDLDSAVEIVVDGRRNAGWKSVRVTRSIEVPAPKKRSTMRCGKCGALGFRADGCGRTHNVPEPDNEQAEEDPEPGLRVPATATPARPARPDRFAAIEASAAKRRAAGL